MKRSEQQWLVAGAIGGFAALALFVAKDAMIGSYLALAFGCAFGFGWRGARQVDAEAAVSVAPKADVRGFGKRGA